MERPKCKNDDCDHLAKPSKKYKSGYAPFCSSCEQKKYGIWEKRKLKDYHQKARYKDLTERIRARYIKALSSLDCQICGFSPVDLCQMDVHHKDGNHANNSEDNLQLLCANCHRLEHALNGRLNQKIFSSPFHGSSV